MPIGQRLQTGWQLFSSWHLGASDQHRDHGNLPFEGRLDFDPHEILGVVKSRFTPIVRGPIPVRPDHREKDVTLGHLFIQMLAKVHTKWDGIHIDKYRLSSKLVDKPIINPTGDIGTILRACL
jgi:hypothetical protein